MANLVEQREARRREQRASEREQSRREERLEQAGEQVRERAREQEREEQARQDSLAQARAYALEDERRRAMADRARQRARAARRELVAELAGERAAAQAAREAAAVARREQAAVIQAQQQRWRAQQQDRRHDRRTDQREADREADREAGREVDRESGRRESARAAAADQGRAAAAAATRRGQDREQGRAHSQERDRRAQADRATREQAREHARRDAREDERREQAAGRRSRDRAAERRQAQQVHERSEERRRALAQEQRRDRGLVTSGPAMLGALRVNGPLLLDETDRPVRLRGVLLPGPDRQHRDRDGSVRPAVSPRELDLIAAWGATLVVLPLTLDALFDVPELPDGLLAPLPPGAVLAHQEDLGPPPSAAAPDRSLLETLDATVDAAQECGLRTIVQLAGLRSEDDERLIEFAWLRRFWQVLGERYEATPSVLFDLLRGPAGTGLNGTMLRPGGDVAARQRQHIALALLGELRRVHPGAVVVVESPDGVVPPGPLSLTDGRAAPNVITGVRLGAAPDAVALAAVAALARTAPVLVMDWGAEADLFVPETTGRRLAAVGAHWVAGGWPSQESLPETGRLVATGPGRALQRALVEADRAPLVGPLLR